MPKTKIEKKGDAEKAKETYLVSGNPTSSTDIVNVAIRQDGSIMLSLLSVLPDQVKIENHRTVLSADTAKSLIDVLCQTTGYYPRTPRKKAKRAVKKES